MDYRLTYARLIEKFRNEVPSGYSEKHHIIPRCMGGTDDKDNLVKLPARHHFVAHLLLAKIHGGKLIHAAYYMVTNKRYTSRKYEWLKAKKANLMKGNKFGAGRVFTQEHRDKLSKKAKGHPFYGSGITADVVARRTAHMKGNKLRLGNKHSAEVIAKIHKTAKCTKCGFESTACAIGHWHNEKCKMVA